MSRNTIPIAIIFTLAVHAPFLAQTAPGGQQPGPIFKAGVDLVALSVTVVDERQKCVSGLAPEDFQVFEDGVLQNVSFFAAGRTPLDLAILLDTSASMNDKLPLAQTAAVGLARSLRPGDRTAVVDLKDRVDVLQGFTDDPARLESAIRRTQASGGTALYNAVYVALKQFAALGRSSNDVRRQAIVVLSDGNDTVSVMSFDDVLDLAKRSGVAIYTVSLKSEYALLHAKTGHAYFSQSDFSMKSLAQETGARSFFPADARELPAIYASIGEELASQYALGYAPTNPRADGTYRRVVVRVVNRPDVRPRTRTGYFASRAARVIAGQGQ